MTCVELVYVEHYSFRMELSAGIKFRLWLHSEQHYPRGYRYVLDSILYLDSVEERNSEERIL